MKARSRLLRDGVAQLAQGLGLDLADALSGDLEVLAHLFQGVILGLADAEAKAQHPLFPGA